MIPFGTPKRTKKQIMFLLDQETEKDRRYLNYMDQFVLSIDEAMRTQGSVGFETQVLLWCNGRIDQDRLRTAIARLCRLHPVMTAMLVKGSTFRRAFWQMRPGRDGILHEVNLASSSSRSVLDLAARLLSEPRDLARHDPITFYLLHLSDGRDIFLIQYNHVLMDIHDVVPLIRELELHSAARPSLVPVAPWTTKFTLTRSLVKRPLILRMQEFAKLIAAWARTLCRRQTAIKAHGRSTPTSERGFQFAVRVVSKADTKAMEENIAHKCGFTSLSMAVLASSLRGIRYWICQGQIRKGRLTFGLGLDLGLRRSRAPAFQNLASIIPVQARIQDLEEWTVLTRNLGQQIRKLLEGGCEWGMVQLAAYLQVAPAFAKPITRFFMKRALSFWYAYIGSLDAVGTHLCGAEIEHVQVTSPCSSPAGLGLMAHKFRGQLVLQATYLPSLVPSDLVEEFLEFVIKDLKPPRSDSQ